MNIDKLSALRSAYLSSYALTVGQARAAEAYIAELESTIVAVIDKASETVAA